MPISFSQIPSEIKVPLYWVEVDPSKAGLPVLKQPALLVGTMIDSGEAPPDIPIAIGSQAQADKAFGQGSELSRMFRAFYANNTSGLVYGLPVAEPTGGTAATGIITVTTAPSEPGTIHLYIGGTHVPVNIGATDTVNEIHAAISAAINENDDLPVSSVGSPTEVTLTALWKGISGNEITVAMNYYGRIGSEDHADRPHHRATRHRHADRRRRRSGFRRRDRCARRAGVRICRDAVHRLRRRSMLGTPNMASPMPAAGAGSGAFRSRLLGSSAATTAT